MLATEILLSQFDRLSGELTNTLDGITTEQFNQPHGSNTLTIGFNAWHVFRTMDNVVNFAFQRKQPVWLAEGYVEKFDVPKNAQGTGMDLDEAQGIVIPDADLLREYARETLASCRPYIAGLTDDDLNETVTVKPMGDMPRWQALSQIVVTHCSQHVGEMNMARGLLGLRGAVEPTPGLSIDAPEEMAMEIEIQALPRQETAVIRLNVAPAELPTVMGPAISEVFEQVSQQGIAPVGAWFDRYFSMADTWDLEVGVPVARSVEPAGRVVPGELPQCDAAIAVHVGPYETLAETYEQFDQWLLDNRREATGVFWQVYEVGPEAEDDQSRWRTRIVRPLAS